MPQLGKISLSLREMAEKWVLQSFRDMGASDEEMDAERVLLEDEEYLFEMSELTGFKTIESSLQLFVKDDEGALCVLDLKGEGTVNLRVSSSGEISIQSTSFVEGSSGPGQGYLRWYAEEVCRQVL